MSHKVHPKAFRLRDAQDWSSRWLSKKNVPKYLEGDFKIRKFLSQKLKDSAIQDIEIERFQGKINVIINSARPGFIIGRGGQGIEDLRKQLLKIIGQDNKKEELKIEIREIKNPWTSASLTSQWIAQQLEKRMPHRRVVKQAMQKMMANKEVEGARIEISGRLGGNEIARREWLQKGRMPRQTLRAIIDYNLAEAFCTYGVIGAKVWIYKGLKFE